MPNDGSILIETEITSIPRIVQDLRKSANAKRCHPVSFRKEQLHRLIKGLHQSSRILIDALVADLKTPTEAKMEVDFVISEALEFVKCLDRWTGPSRVHNHESSSLGMMFHKAYAVNEPLGVVLVISPWNYPLLLSLLPFIGALGGGNCVLLKPSESSVNSSNAMANLISRYLDPHCYQVVNGGVSHATELLALKYDHIFYTGSGRVAQLILEKAAKHLTPVTLELGGKSPTIVTENCGPIQSVAKRIIFGKGLNSGQTCIAPDYVFVHESKYLALVDQMKSCIEEFYACTEDTLADPLHYGSMINQARCQAVASLLKDKSEFEILFQGKSDLAARRFGLVLVKVDINKAKGRLMTEEIFGPILPVITYSSLETEVVPFINSGDKPLALYMFSKVKAEVDYVLANTSSGTVCVNDAALQFISQLPFGGVGPSGMGSYRGYRSFQIFTHEKRILQAPVGLEFLNNWVRYPPFDDTASDRLLALLLNVPFISEIRTGRYYTSQFMRTLASLYYIIFGRPKPLQQ